MDDTRHLASWIGGQEALHERVLTLDEALAAVEAVRSEDIQRLAGGLFRDEVLRLAVVAPGRDLRGLDRPCGCAMTAQATPAEQRPTPADPGCSATAARADRSLADDPERTPPDPHAEPVPFYRPVDRTHADKKKNFLKRRRPDSQLASPRPPAPPDGGARPRPRRARDARRARALDEEALLDLAEVRWRTDDLAGAGEAADAALGRGARTARLVIACEATAALGRPARRGGLPGVRLAASAARPALRRDHRSSSGRRDGRADTAATAPRPGSGRRYGSVGPRRPARPSVRRRRAALAGGDAAIGRCASPWRSA